MSKSYPSFETVAWQRDNKLKPAVTALYQEVLDAAGNLAKQLAALDKIHRLVFETVGLSFTSKVVEKSWFFGPYEISVEVPNLTAISPINKAAVERLHKFDIANMKITDLLNGKIDYQSGNVSGFFSELKHEITYSTKTLNGDLTAPMLTALHFHEVGHAWVNCVLLGESLATNIVIAEYLGQYDFTATAEKKIQVGKAALKLSGVNSDLPKDADVAEITALVLKGQVDRIQRHAGTRWYDHRLTETLADQFAVRFGTAADLIRALSVLERSQHIFADHGYEPRWIGQLFNFMNIVMIPMAFQKSVVQGGVEVMVKVGAAEGMQKLLKSVSKTFLCSFFISGFGAEMVKKINGTAHAPLKERIKVIRRDAVSELKNPNLPAAARKAILGDLEIIDATAAEAHPFTDVYALLSKYLTNVITGRKVEFDHHHMVDDLANNRLYEFSALLKG